MTNQRQKPDLEYLETNTQNIVNLLIEGYQKIAQKRLYPADPLRLFILWIADIIVQQRILINYSAKQNIPRFAEGIYLDNLVEFLNDTIKRLPAQNAKTTIKYTLSTVRNTATIVPKGSRTTHDGKIFFKTTRDLIIPIGEIAGTVEAQASATGEIANGIRKGEIKKIVDYIPYLDHVENITTTAGGAEEESDQNLYERYRNALSTYSTAGPEGAYRFFAKTASQNIIDVKTLSPTPGIAEIRILMKGGKLPEEETINAVQKILSAENIRPLTDKVIVKASDKIPYNIDITYYTLQHGISSPKEIEARIQNAVEKYKTWQSNKMGRDINPSKLNQFLMEEGIKRVEIKEPHFQIIKETSVAIAEKVTIISGGLEDE